MRKFILFLLTGILPTIIIGQNCPPPSVVEYVSSSNSEALITNGQLMWNNTQESSSHYYVPSNSGLSPFYAGGFWIGGKDAGQQLHLAATMYNHNGDDFFPGPLSTDGLITASNCLSYDNIFYITRAMATNHLAYYTALANGTADIEFPGGYFMPSELINYPAHGNTSPNEAEYLAPFYDFDNDGNYDPYQGDCPLFTGMGIETNCSSCDQLMGDVVYYWINNDAGNVHTETNGLPFGIEIHNTAYAYPQNISSEIANSTFYTKKIINRSSLDYHDVYIGIYVDADIGNSTDDYVACDISRKLGYGFNGDPFDEPISSSAGYGQNSPAAGVMFLNAPLAEADNLDNDNDGIIDNEHLGMSHFMYYSISGPGMNGPETPLEYYNYLKGHWKDGTPLTYGGNGHSDNTGVVTNHMYPDDYVLPGFQPWSEYSEWTPPGDRRFLMSAGPFNLAAGESVCLQFATVIGFPTNTFTAIEVMKNNADFIATQFDSFCNSNTVSINTIDKPTGAIIWDNNSQEVLVKKSGNSSGQLTVVNALGQTVMTEQVAYQSRTSLKQLNPGIYIVQFAGENQQIITKKINKI